MVQCTLLTLDPWKLVDRTYTFYLSIHVHGQNFLKILGKLCVPLKKILSFSAHFIERID